MDKISYLITVGDASHKVVAASRTYGKELLLFLHGLGCSKESFRDVWLREEFKDFSILAFQRIQINNSGHFMMADNPNHFYARLEEFIEQRFPKSSRLL